MYPVVAIIGRPNVGKSSLFNRIVGKSKAIVSEMPGTTRNFVDAVIRKKNQLPYTLIDTAGIMDLEMETSEEEELEAAVQKQVKYAIEYADILVFLIDVQEKDLLPTDKEAAELLRRSKKSFILVANKADNKKWEEHAVALYELGLGAPHLLSVSHKIGLKELEEKIQEMLKKSGFTDEIEEPEEDENVVHFSMIGVPNVGKSALFNALVGEEKVLVSNVAGTTRDLADTEIKRDDKTYLCIDTAGIRRRGKIEKGVEKFSIIRTQRAIDRSDVCLLVIDAKKGLNKQDMHVAEYILNAKKGLIIVLNKWDLIKTKEDLPHEIQVLRLRSEQLMDQYLSYLHWKLPFLPWAPVIFTSAETKKNVEQVFEVVNSVMESRRQRIDTSRFNRFIERIVEQHKPSGTKSIIPRISYATQVGTNPPHFLIYVNEKKAFHFSYPRYMENKLREKFGFEGTPIIIELRNKTKKDYSMRRKEE